MTTVFIIPVWSFMVSTFSPLCFLFLGVGLIFSQPKPPVNENNLFQFNQGEPATLAALVIGNGLTPGPAGANFLSTLFAGDVNELAMWSLDGPFSSRREKSLLAVFSMIPTLCGHNAPLGAFAWLKSGDELDFWTLINSDVVRPIPGEFLERIVDERPIHGPMADDLEASAYTQFAFMANQTSEHAFIHSSRKNLNYADIMRQPKTYRGEVLEISGRLRRLRAIPAPLALQNLGITTLYEGWVFQEIYGPHPIAFISTQLPSGVQPYEQGNTPVVFQGYFFKKYRYKSANTGATNPWVDSPLFIGRTFQTRPIPLDEMPVDTDWAKGLLPLFLSFIILMCGAIVGFTFWFKRGDKTVSARIQNRQASDPFPFKDNANSGNQFSNPLSNESASAKEDNGQNYPGYRI